MRMAELAAAGGSAVTRRIDELSAAEQAAACRLDELSAHADAVAGRVEQGARTSPPAADEARAEAGGASPRASRAVEAAAGLDDVAGRVDELNADGRRSPPGSSNAVAGRGAGLPHRRRGLRRRTREAQIADVGTAAARAEAAAGGAALAGRVKEVQFKAWPSPRSRSGSSR